jgi:hypothetical protein
MDNELERVFNEMKGPCLTANLHLRFLTRYVGGQPAGEEAIAAFVEHHLGLTGDAAEKAVKRIVTDEVQLSDNKTDEVDEKYTYGLNVIRRTKAGMPWVGTWQVRAMLKQTASRLGLFVAVKGKRKSGGKGDMAEMMIIKATGPSLAHAEKDEIQQIVLVDSEGLGYDTKHYDKYRGCVSTPNGKKSIVSDVEYAPAGCEMHLSVSWPTMRIKEADMAAVWAAGQGVGLGSMKAYECGRFEVVSLDIE